jgi:Ca2+-binding EF-hand superfamily protein
MTTVTLKDLEAEDALTDEQMQRFDGIFVAVDKDKSGRIDESELKTVLRKCGFELNDAAVEMVMNSAQIDGRSSLPRAEFAYFLGRVLRLRNAFQALNKPQLDLNDISGLLKSFKFEFTAKQTQTLFSLLDRDASGTIELAEWLQLGVFLRFCKLQFVLASPANGAISRAELEQHLPPLGLDNVPAAMIDAVFAQTDTSRDGFLQFEEFATLVAKIKIRKAKPQ